MRLTGKGLHGSFLGFCLLAFSTLAPSLALSATFGAGNIACSDWAQITESGNDRSSAEEWLLGYLSGISSSETVAGTDPDEMIAGVNNYCAANPRQPLEQAARSLVLPPGIAIAGLGSSEGPLVSQADMNDICRSSFPNRALGFYPVRWATTTDFKEYSTSKGWNQNMAEIEEDFAMRAENTLISSGGVAYDQATGAITTAGEVRFPGAVVNTSSGAWFRSKWYRAKPLCVWGRPNPDFR